jgi:ribosomal protein S18 acetylase RimI-like enzyme
VELAIRPYAADDFDACVRLLAALPEWRDLPESVRDYGSVLGGMPVRVATVGERVDALLAVLPSPHARSAELHLLAVAPHARERGVGRALVEHVLAELRAGGTRTVTAMLLDPAHDDGRHDPARRLYEALGFEPLPRPEALAAQPTVQWVKRL